MRTSKIAHITKNNVSNSLIIIIESSAFAKTKKGSMQCCLDTYSVLLNGCSVNSIGIITWIVVIITGIRQATRKLNKKIT